MPLAERDVNSQHHQSSTRAKRLPAAGHENAPPSSKIHGVRVTPARQRFFAATKASAAKTSPPSSADRTRQPHSNTTPHSQTPSSKLPRRNVAASKLTPPTSKWNPTSIRRLNHLEKTSEDAEVSPCAREAPQSADQSLIDLGSAPAATHHIRAGKPLPSRPLASLVDGPSPSKDSRSLVDASERPLRLSLAGSECDWPTLLPTSYSTPTLAIPSSSGAMAESPLPSGRLSVSAASLLAASMDITHLADDHYSGAKLDKPHSIASRSSSTLSNASPLDAEQTSERADTGINHASMPKHVIYTDPNIASPYPPRTSSLGNRSGDINPMKRSESANATIAGSADFARDTTEQSRPHSPSPASFSRPRPTSVSHSPGVSSVTSVVAMTPVRSSKTASRIPLPDQKKATLVDIKARRTSSIPIPKLEKGLSFGGRRIDSPDPLKVLDHGIKRRQLQRANTNGSNSTASTVPTRLIIDDPLPVDCSKANTPDSTIGSSVEEEEITTPSDRPLHFVKHGYKPKHMKKASTTYHGGQSFNVHDDTEVILGRPPPSNSPFTGPLQTIPSQSMLPLLATSEDGSAAESPCPKVVIKPTEFSTFAQRLSELEDARALASEDRRTRHSLIDVGTKSELVEILRDAKHEDALISQCGVAGLDEETRLEITRTLSMLEGKCDPPTTAVDLGHLSKMFGRLKSGFEKAPKSATFVEDATVAERFLAKQDAASETAKHAVGAQVNDDFETPATNYNREGATSPMSVGKTSKWSNSTASIKRQSLPFTEETSAQSIFGLDLESLPPGLPPKDLPKEAPISIGYPSRMPGKAHRLLGTDDRILKSQKQTTRRVSSPTLGARVPGSVRAAREKARDAAGSRAYKASDTKVNKMPTSNTKVFSISGETPRGRNPSTESSYRTNQTKQLPRSHSKSRYMLEKINGLFSGRRDRRNSRIPPVPPIKDTSSGVKPPGISQEVRINSLGSPMLKGARAPPLTKMPTISPPVDSVHPALRSAPSLASVAPSNITAGSASHVDYEGRRSLQALSEKLLSRAQAESNPARKERLLSFAKVLNDSIISAREAQISAETAQTAARSAQLSYEMTMKSVTMLQHLASSMNRRC
ncbi:hypothetical protein Q7P37_004768 [Cladosporium fusiforme]